MGSLSEMKQPEFKAIDLLNGKKAIVGPITLEVLCWVEEKFGDWEAFQENALKKRKLAPIASFIFQMLQNKSDFTSETEFLTSFPLTRINDLFDVLNSAVSSSMIKVDTPAVQGEQPEEKKP
jgi:uncharacterized protein YjfI (DUF2170 family)